MRSVLRSTLALGAVLALVAMVAGPASAALPEFSGFVRGAPIAFTGTSGELQITEVGGTYICKSSSISGEIINAKEVANVVLKFSSGPGAETCLTFCKTSTGLWETTTLKGRIAYLSRATRTVGLLLEPVTEPVANCTHFGFAGAKIKGSVIAEIGPVNVRRMTPFSLKYERSGGSSSQQSWRHFEGEEVLHNLSMLASGTTREFALSDNLTLTTASTVEIEA
jgi:hypothetical protein